MSDWPWPAPADDGGARHLLPGMPLPDVALPSTAGGVVHPARVPGLAVLYCYTWTGRPGVPNPPGWDDLAGAHGSTPEAEGFRDLVAEYRAAGATIVGISTQDTAWQSEFAGRLGLPFDLASDAHLEFARALRLPTFEAGGAVFLKRLTIVARDGRVLAVVYPVHPPDSHARELLPLVTTLAARS